MFAARQTCSMEVSIPLEAVSAVGESSEVSQITSGVANTGIVHSCIFMLASYFVEIASL